MTPTNLLYRLLGMTAHTLLAELSRPGRRTLGGARSMAGHIRSIYRELNERQKREAVEQMRIFTTKSFMHSEISNQINKTVEFPLPIVL